MNSDPIVCKRCGLFQDEPVIKRCGVHMTAYCSGCGEYIQRIRQVKPVLYFGKYKGRLLADVAKFDPAYLRWFLGQDIKDGLRRNITEALSEVQA